MNVGLLLLAVFLVLIFVGMPISMGMGISAMAGLFNGGYDLSILPVLIEKGSNNYTLIAIPYFLLAANLMNSTGITHRIYDFVDALCCRMHGGLAQGNVVGSMIFAGISGTSSGDAAGLGMIEIEAMKKKGYDLGWSASVTLASSILGPIIPPSAPFIVFAMLAEVSVTELFVAGVIPGILIAALLMITNVIIARSGKVACPAPEPFSIRRLGRTFVHGFLALMAPVIMLVGIMSGVVTATEVGIVAVLYAVIVGLIYKTLTIKSVLQAFKDTVVASAIIMFLLGMGYAIGYVLTLERVPQLLTTALMGLSDNKYVLLLIINLLLLVLGCFIDGATIRIITVPLLLPIIDALGISRIHFGVFHTLNLLIGYCTPPVGGGLMIIASITKMNMTKLVKSFLIFFIPLLVALFILVYVPGLSTWLPSLVFG